MGDRKELDEEKKTESFHCRVTPTSKERIEELAKEYTNANKTQFIELIIKFFVEYYEMMKNNDMNKLNRTAITIEDINKEEIDKICKMINGLEQWRVFYDEKENRPNIGSISEPLRRIHDEEDIYLILNHLGDFIERIEPFIKHKRIQKWNEFLTLYDKYKHIYDEFNVDPE